MQFSLIIQWANMTSIILKPFPAREKSSTRNRVGDHEGQHCFAGQCGWPQGSAIWNGRWGRGGGPTVCRQGSRTTLEHWVTYSKTCSRGREVFWIVLRVYSTSLHPWEIHLAHKGSGMGEAQGGCVYKWILFFTCNFREGAKGADKVRGNWLKVSHVAWLLFLLIKIKPYCVLTV